MEQQGIGRCCGKTGDRSVRYNRDVELLRGKEIEAEMFAHMMDDAIHIPGTRVRFGIDPILGLIPVVGDVLTVVSGSFILLTARQLGVPAKELLRMMYYQFLNGVIGAFPSSETFIRSVLKAMPKVLPSL